MNKNIKKDEEINLSKVRIKKEKLTSDQKAEHKRLNEEYQKIRQQEKAAIREHKKNSRIPFGQKIKRLTAREGIIVEEMHFNKNKLSSTLIFFGIMCMVIAFSTIYGYIQVISYACAVDIIANIVLLLALFLTSEKCKVYDFKWGIIAIILGVIVITKSFIYPTMVFNQTFNGVRVLDTTRYIINIAFSVIGGIGIGLAGGLTIFRAGILKKSSANLQDSIKESK